MDIGQASDAKHDCGDSVYGMSKLKNQTTHFEK